MRAIILAIAIAACSQQPAQPPAGETPEASASSQQGAASALDNIPSWETARAQGVDFRGVGQEPGWIVDIYQDGRIKLIYDYGEATAEFPSSEPSYPQEGATRYAGQNEGRSLVVTIRRFPCSDAMSGEAYPAVVEVVIDGRTLNGCGRTV